MPGNTENPQSDSEKGKVNNFQIKYFENACISLAVEQDNKFIMN
jgi:hypothetical protein